MCVVVHFLQQCTRPQSLVRLQKDSFTTPLEGSSAAIPPKEAAFPPSAPPPVTRRDGDSSCAFGFNIAQTLTILYYSSSACCTGWPPGSGRASLESIKVADGTRDRQVTTLRCWRGQTHALHLQDLQYTPILLHYLWALPKSLNSESSITRTALQPGICSFTASSSTAPFLRCSKLNGTYGNLHKAHQQCVHTQAMPSQVTN